MPAVTPVVPASFRERAKPYQAYQHEVHRFDNIEGGDTWTVDTTTIVNHAWRRDGVGAPLSRWNITDATTMTFLASATSSGVLHIWRRG